MNRKLTKMFAIAAVAAAPLLYIRSAVAQAGMTFEVLAGGYSTEKHVKIHAKGPSDVLQTRLVVQPGADTGYHTHAGPVIAVVKSGVLTQYHENGCITQHPAGSVFFEEEGGVHKVVNHGAVASEAYLTFILPTGSQPLEPAPTPAPKTCGAGPAH